MAMAAPLFWSYIPRMLWRSSRDRPLNAPAAFIHPCQPIVAKLPAFAGRMNSSMMAIGCRFAALYSLEECAVATLHIEHGITDFSTWKANFDRFAVKRSEAGVTAHRIYQPHDNAAYVII